MADREKLIELVRKMRTNITAWHTSEEIADMLIANGVTFAKDINVPGWIPVTERLPENDLEDVLAFDGISCCLISFTRTDIYGKKYFVIGHNDITHWMPLPEPPMEVEG